MRRLFLLYACLVLLSAGRFGLGALEIELTGGLNNLFFKESATDPSPFFSFNFSLRDDISGDFAYSIDLERDSIWQNSITSRVITRTDNFRVEFGLFFGSSDKIDNNFKNFDFGVTGALEVTFPGIVFLSLSGSSTLGAELDFLGNNSRRFGEIKLGFWLPNTIASLSASSKSYHGNFSSGALRLDTLNRFALSADFYSKNTPVLLSFDFGYEKFQRSYDTSGGKNNLNALFAGLGIAWRITPAVQIKIEAEAPIHIFAETSTRDFKNPWTSLYKVYGGVVYSFY